MGWFSGNHPTGPRPAALKSPNHWGLFDMHGNVAEWCSERFPGEPAVRLRPVRGGAFSDPAGDCRSAARTHRLPTAADATTGFRVVCHEAR